MEIDYKKEYKAMVQRARELHETGNELTKRQMEIVCPQLRESEDERVRKELIAILKKSYNSGIILNNKKDLDRYLAYLERQKEQKPLITGNDFGWIDELKHDLKHPEELDQKVDDVLKQRKGIRTFEWSEEDERILNSIIAYIETGNIYATSKVNMKVWLKSFRPPKQEWDEFDEDCLKRAIWYVENPAPSVVKDTNLALWLKSLPGRFTLQPKQEWSEDIIQKSHDFRSNVKRFIGRL